MLDTTNAYNLVKAGKETSSYGNPAIDAKMEAIRELKSVLDAADLKDRKRVETVVDYALNDPKFTRKHIKYLTKILQYAL